MPVEDIVRWLREDHDGLQEATDRLRERIAKPPRGDRSIWIKELCQRFDDFVACARQRMAREEEGGYLRPIRDARPSLAAQVDLLQREHVELNHLTEDVSRAVHALVPQDHLLLRDCCRRIETLLRWFERHEEHENHMVLYVFAQESTQRD